MVAALLMSGCNQPPQKDSEVTPRIMYDVPIVNHSDDAEWYRNNIEGSRRENFLRHILDAVKERRVEVYDFFTHEKLASGSVDRILERTDTLTVQRSKPPYEYYDTIVHIALDMKDIHKMRFVEAWQMDEQSLQMVKVVKGLVPMVASYTGDGMLRGYRPVFYISLDGLPPEL